MIAPPSVLQGAAGADPPKNQGNREARRTVVTIEASTTFASSFSTPACIFPLLLNMQASQLGANIINYNYTKMYPL